MSEDDFYKLKDFQMFEILYMLREKYNYRYITKKELCDFVKRFKSTGLKPESLKEWLETTNKINKKRFDKEEQELEEIFRTEPKWIQWHKDAEELNEYTEWLIKKRKGELKNGA